MNFHNFSYPRCVTMICDLFTSAKFKIYLSGGSVRDIILGTIPRDYDLITNALPSEIKEILITANIKYHLRGDNYGTYGCILDKTDIDIGSLMKEVPTITFGCTIEEDSGRRDITYNALYYDFENLTLIDLVGGLADIQTGTVRIIGNPIQRFHEDKLRILRVLRYACRYNHIIAEETFAAIKSIPIGVIVLSKERIYSELKKAFAGDFDRYLTYLKMLGMFDLVFPNMICDYDGGITADYLCIYFAYIFRNDTDVEKKLIWLRYDKKIIREIIFLLRMINFQPEFVRMYISDRKKINIDRKCLLDWCDIMNLGMYQKKFCAYESVCTKSMIYQNAAEQLDKLEYDSFMEKK